MITILIDSNIYGWELSYVTGSRNERALNCNKLITLLLEEVDKKKPSVNVLSFEIVIKELKEAKNYDLIALHDSIVSGVIKISDRIKSLSNKYFEECKKANLFNTTIEDCQIVAAATVSGSSYMVTENRKTLSRKEAVDIYQKINNEKGLKTPKIMDAKKAVSELFS